MDGRTAGATRHWRAGQWLADGSLDSVVEINHQCLDYLAAMAVAGSPCCPALFAGQGSAWFEMPNSMRLRLAASPYLLADAAFDDESRWRCLAPRMVQDVPAQFVEPVFVGADAGDFIRRVLVFGWHLARANRQLARVVLGMAPACADRIAALRLQDLDWLAQHRPGWVRPRWERQPRIWQHLLLAARAPDGELLTQVSLRGLQLMATGVLGTTGRPRGFIVGPLPSVASKKKGRVMSGKRAISGRGFAVAAVLASVLATPLDAQQAAPGIAPVSLTQPEYTFDTAEQHRLQVSVVAKGMNHPFAIALMRDGDALISERGGALRLLRNAVGAPGKPTTLEAQPVGGVPAIEMPFRLAGLHDLALHPRFSENHLVYFTFNKSGTPAAAAAGATARPQARLAVMRGRFDGKALVDVKEIWVGKSSTASGSRMVFGTDGLIYISIGAAFGDEAQKFDNTVGKILRITDEGAIPPDNPFVKQAGAEPSIYTLGHRDPLGLAVHPVNGAVLNAEHGPNGGDEVNLIRAGRNYGWPRVTFGRDYNGAELSASPVAPDVEAPLLVWLPSIGPSGPADLFR